MAQQSLRQIKRRIRSVENTKKLTRAMEMIAMVKLNAFQNKLLYSKGYFSKLERLFNNLLSGYSGCAHPFLEKREKKENIALCVITSDSGLCAGYNSNVISAAEHFILGHGERKINLVLVGKKGVNYFKKRGIQVSKAYPDFHGDYSAGAADKVAANLTDLFLSGKADEVHVVYTYFETTARHKPRVERIFDIESSQGEQLDYLVEPDINSILNRLIPLYISAKFRFILLNSAASEYAARAIAMGEATENAKELLEGLVLFRNKVRQANITKEIIEVISSADALKG